MLMANLLLAALLVLGSAPAATESSQPAVPIQPSVDSAERRQVLRDLSVCLAESRPRWARQMLSHPYLSDAQARLASESLRGTDTCIREDSEVTFRTSSMAGSLAEHFVRTEIQRVDFARLAGALATVPPLNVSEDFALCVASRDPVRARDLALSEFGSSVEIEAARQLAAHVATCTNRGEQLTVDLQALRALISTALYRGMMTVLN
jgi:hypothetical protein